MDYRVCCVINDSSMAKSMVNLIVQCSWRKDDASGNPIYYLMTQKRNLILSHLDRDA